MLMIKRKKLMSKTLIALLSVVVLGGLLLVNPAKPRRSKEERLGPPPLAHGLASAPARALAGAQWAPVLVLPPGAPPGLQRPPQEVMCTPAGASEPVPASAAVQWALAPVLPPGVPRGLQDLAEVANPRRVAETHGDL
jgi:hypothetical protein